MAKTDKTDEKDTKTHSHTESGSGEHKMSAAEAGRLGGEKVLKERGPEFYSEIGSHQGKGNNPGNFANRSDAAEAGRNGGKARTNSSGDTSENKKAA